MTTRVVISVPSNNHLAARYTIEQVTEDNDWNATTGGIILQGQCVEKNIWKGSRIVIEETEYTPQLPVETTTEV